MRRETGTTAAVALALPVGGQGFGVLVSGFGFRIQGFGSCHGAVLLKWEGVIGAQGSSLEGVGSQVGAPALHPHHSTLTCNFETLNPQLHARNPKPKTQTPKILNPKPSTCKTQNPHRRG